MLGLQWMVAQQQARVDQLPQVRLVQMLLEQARVAQVGGDHLEQLRLVQLQPVQLQPDH